MTKRSRPRTITAGTPLSLSRTRSAAAAASSAIAIRVASSSRPSASRAAAPVVERGEAGAADRDLGLAQPPGAAEAVGDRRPRPDARRRADLGADAAGRGVGVLGQQADRVRLGQVGAVDAGVGADEAVVGLDDQDAALGAQHLAALLEDQLDQGRLLAEHRGELARFGAGHAPRRAGAARPSALETTFCAMTTTSPSSSSARSAISSPSAHPLVDLRQAGDGATRSSPVAVAHIPSALAVRLARPRLRLQLAGSGRRRRPGCRGRGRARAAPRPRRGCRPRGRRRRGGRSCPRRRRARSRRRARAPGRWCRCRGGRGRSRRSARACRSAAGRARAGRAAGSRRGGGRRSRRPRLGAGDPGQRRPEWPASSGSGTTSAPTAGGELDCATRVAADDDRALDRPRRADRLQHVGEHRRRQRPRAASPSMPGGEPLLGRVEALDGQDRGRLQP